MLLRKPVTFVNDVAGGIDMGVDNEQVAEEVLEALRGTGLRNEGNPETPSSITIGGKYMGESCYQVSCRI